LQLKIAEEIETVASLQCIPGFRVMKRSVQGQMGFSPSNKTLSRSPGIYRLAANGMMDYEQENDYAGGNKAINPRALGARSRHMIEKYLCNDAKVSKNCILF